MSNILFAFLRVVLVFKMYVVILFTNNMLSIPEKFVLEKLCVTDMSVRGIRQGGQLVIFSYYCLLLSFSSEDIFLVGELPER